MTYQCVIFDCDGVLIDSERLAVTFDAELFADFGWVISEQEIVDRYLGKAYPVMVGELAERVGGLPDDFDETYRAGLERLFRAELRPVDGVVEALDAIEAAGVPTCVASSSWPERLELSLGLVGLHERFDGRIFSASEVERGKPAPDLFLHAATKMGVDPSGCAVIEDSEYGTQAARAAGMAGFGYLGGLLPAERLAGPGTTLFTDMRALPGLLDLARD